MPEPVRLVIWDLDDTFWSGILAEGPIALVSEAREVVRELVHRGIMCSICSRNNLDRARAALAAAGLWDFFVFPSIDWEPKGPRIRALIEAIQLRPPTVFFIDDNPSNLAEARHFNPEIQTAGSDVIPRILADPLFAGKPDPDLVRLHQYKVMEQRNANAADWYADVRGFLLQSRIQVEIRHDLEEKLDRVLELINRTHQLNYTKRRLSEDPDVARSKLAEQLRSHEVQAGLLRVADRYGVHGDAGFYMIRNGDELLHFCFSCRILGMGVETWLYRRLGRPRLAIVGEVAANPVLDTRSVDWITLTQLPEDAAPPGRCRFDWVAARGGCDLQALSHYFRVGTGDVIGEFNVGRAGFDARVDHSSFLRYCVEGLSPEAIEASARLGYQPEDFKTALLEPRRGSGLILLSFWSDVSYALYRHRRLGFLLPFALSGQSDHCADARSRTTQDIPEHLRKGWMARALATLKCDYDFVGIIDEHLFKDNLRAILAALPRQVPTIIIQGNTRLTDPEQGVTHISDDNLRMNEWIAATAGNFANAIVLDIRDVIAAEEEVLDWSHFNRLVYFRLYQRICRIVGERI
jgi:FkbH-like protein